MPHEYYSIPFTNDSKILIKELNRVLDSLSRRLNHLTSSGNDINFNNNRAINLGVAMEDADALRRDQAINVDGTIPLIANWNAGPYKITALNFESTTATSTMPFICVSTTLCTNLNADLLDGLHASNFSTTFSTSAQLAAILSDETGSTGDGKAVFNKNPFFDIAIGTSPFSVTSTTIVTNLNADAVDGKHVGTSGNTIPLLDGINIWSGANTFSSTWRSSTANFRRYYHIALGAMNPGATGPTWVEASANTTGGWRLTNAAWFLRGQTNIHADWDGASDFTAHCDWMVNINNIAGGVNDTVDLKITVYYKGFSDTATKSQTVEVATTVGQSPQYKQFHTTFTIDWDLAGNIVEVGDVMAIILNLETDTSEVADIVVTSMEFYYNTTHIGIESGDV